MLVVEGGMLVLLDVGVVGCWVVLGVGLDVGCSLEDCQHSLKHTLTRLQAHPNFNFFVDSLFLPADSLEGPRKPTPKSQKKPK